MKILYLVKSKCRNKQLEIVVTQFETFLHFVMQKGILKKLITVKPKKNKAKKVAAFVFNPCDDIR